MCGEDLLVSSAGGGRESGRGDDGLGVYLAESCSLWSNGSRSSLSSWSSSSASTYHPKTNTVHTEIDLSVHRWVSVRVRGPIHRVGTWAGPGTRFVVG
jgi:hypothetical protein